MGWGGLLKDWNKPKPEPEPVEPPPVMEELAAKIRAQQQMYEMQGMQNMQGINPYQQGFGGGLSNIQAALHANQQYHGMFQPPPPPPVPLTQVVPMRATIYGREVKTLSAQHIVAGLAAMGIPKDEMEQHVRRELAYKLAHEMMKHIAVTRMPDMSNRDGVIFETTVHIAYEDRK